MNNDRYKMKRWILAFFTILNLGTIGFFWFNHFNESRLTGEPHLKELIARELKFDENQKEMFYKIVKFHQDESAIIREEISNAKREYYRFDQNQDQNRLALLSLQNAYGRLDTLNYTHFMQIRSICKGEQIEAFNLLIGKIITNADFGFSGPRKGR